MSANSSEAVIKMKKGNFHIFSLVLSMDSAADCLWSPLEDCNLHQTQPLFWNFTLCYITPMLLALHYHSKCWFWTAYPFMSWYLLDLPSPTRISLSRWSSIEKAVLYPIFIKQGDPRPENIFNCCFMEYSSLRIEAGPICYNLPRITEHRAPTENI